jgi:hypothetical protein
MDCSLRFSSGWSRFPMFRIVGMSEVQKRAYIIADNKLALQASGA